MERKKNSILCLCFFMGICQYTKCCNCPKNPFIEFSLYKLRRGNDQVETSEDDCNMQDQQCKALRIKNPFLREAFINEESCLDSLRDLLCRPKFKSYALQAIRYFRPIQVYYLRQMKICVERYKTNIRKAQEFRKKGLLESQICGDCLFNAVIYIFWVKCRTYKERIVKINRFIAILEAYVNSMNKYSTNGYSRKKRGYNVRANNIKK